MEKHRGEPRSANPQVNWNRCTGLRKHQVPEELVWAGACAALSSSLVEDWM